MKSKFILISTLLLIVFSGFAQLSNQCKLKIGTNLGGLADYGTELPFVDLMHSCRTWYSKDANNPAGGPFDSDKIAGMTFRPDGYPTQLPQTVSGSNFTQKVSTIWANTVGWPAGQYTVLYDGAGTIGFWGGFTNLVQVNANKITFIIDSANNATLEMTLNTSAVSNPLRNIRVLMPGTESTYLTQPFNQTWVSKLAVFKSVRFMDWGSTNFWGETDNSWDSPTLRNWDERQKMDRYTWTDGKGVPYEMMIKLMNDYDIDGWVCVPHRTSNNFISNMAQLFKDNVEPQRKLTVEYSNEIWNWMFAQTNWANKYGCVNQNINWPEGIVPYIQNCMNQWTNIYGADVNRIKRAVGLQTGWLDVSQRIAYNMSPTSYDVVAPAYYFGLSDDTLESQLDVLGANATVADVATRVIASCETNEKVWMQQVKTTISDFLNKPMAFYEGGQHITPNPFGVNPTYAQALIDIQRAPVMYQMYNDWYNFVRTLQSGSAPLDLMNFSFVSERSAQYGSWGILETMDQNTAVVPAPKYQSTIENQNNNCIQLSSVNNILENFQVFPNPTKDSLTIKNSAKIAISDFTIFDISGKKVAEFKNDKIDDFKIDISDFQSGIYFLKLISANKTATIKIIKE